MSHNQDVRYPWVDAHAHLTSQEMPYDALELMREAERQGCRGLIEVATDYKSLQRAIALQKQMPIVAIAAAVTPHDAAVFEPEFVEAIEDAVGKGILQAIGETGLDYFHWQATKDAQKKECIRQLELAACAGLPVVIHCRDAFDDFFALLDHHYSQNGRWQPGMLHCFTGTKAEADRLIEEGWMISLSGVVTYKKSQELREIACRIPLDQILIETDAPWLAPQAHRGETNRPIWSLETAKIVAGLQGITVEQLCAAVRDNLMRLIPFKGWEDRHNKRGTL